MKYIVNESFTGYEKVAVQSIESTKGNDDLHMVILDNSSDREIPEYYKYISSALKNRNRVILVNTEDDNKGFKLLASLMVNFNSYDIYNMKGKDDLSMEYLSKLEGRNPDFSEVQTYIGGDITAYSELDNIVYGMQSLTEEGREAELRQFIEDNIGTIDNSVNALNVMKKNSSLFNSNELVEQVKDLKDNNKDLSDKLEESRHTEENLKYDKKMSEDRATLLETENEELKEKVRELEKSLDSSAGGGLTSFKTLDLRAGTVPNNKVKSILYFKEISYVKYTNSLINYLFKYISKQGLRVKMLIYDTHTKLAGKYIPLRVVNGDIYVQDKAGIERADKIVITEPSQNIIIDMLTSNENFDVIIVYDRTNEMNYIIDGPIVTKYFVVNSKSELEGVRNGLKITDSSTLIMNGKTTLGMNERGEISKPEDRKFLDIPEIEGFGLKTDSNRLVSYKKQKTANTKEILLESIFKRSNIETLFRKTI